MDKIGKSIEKIADLAKGLEKGDPYISELLTKLDELKQKMIKGLEEDSRKKAQKKAS